MQKGVAGKWVVYAFDETTNIEKTGDSANITGTLYIDGTSNAIDDTNPTELGGGYYAFDITAVESNGDNIVIVAASTTANIQVVGCPAALYTRPPNFEALSVDANGRVDVIKIAGTTQTANDNGADINAILVDTADMQPKLGTPAGADMSADIAAVKAQTAAIETDTAEIGAAGAGLTEAGGTGDQFTGIASVGAVAGAVGSVTAEVSADVTKINGSATAAVNLQTSADTMIKDTVATGYTETVTTFKGGGTATLSSVNDHYNGRIVIFYDGTLIKQATAIEDYDGTTKVFTVTGLTSAPTDGDTFIIV